VQLQLFITGPFSSTEQLGETDAGDRKQLWTHRTVNWQTSNHLQTKRTFIPARTKVQRCLARINSSPLAAS
jgi:hypothetical protein